MALKCLISVLLEEGMELIILDYMTMKEGWEGGYMLLPPLSLGLSFPFFTPRVLATIPRSSQLSPSLQSLLCDLS